MNLTAEILNIHHFPMDIYQYENLSALAIICNEFLADYQYPVIINSGLRDMALQIEVDFPRHPKKSAHLVGCAVDIHDEQNRLLEYVLSHLDLARKIGLFFENPNWTPTWCHIQDVAPKSGHRFFVPDSSPPKCNRWSGIYDRKYDSPWIKQEA